jgi:hypothetical protein
VTDGASIAQQLQPQVEAGHYQHLLQAFFTYIRFTLQLMIVNYGVDFANILQRFGGRIRGNGVAQSAHVAPIFIALEAAQRPVQAVLPLQRRWL